MKATLILSDGTRFVGESFGYAGATEGEVVFCTAMTGYPESLTDPSYAGQLLVLTFPLVGNYGVPSQTTGSRFPSEARLPVAFGLPQFMESDRIHAKALIVADYSKEYSHWNAKESLGDWLKREHVPAITGIDTRRLTKLLREKGVMMGRIILNEELRMKNEEFATAQIRPNEKYENVNWVERVSCKDIIVYHPDGTSTTTAANDSSFFTLHSSFPRVVLVDCGVKANIIRCLINREVEVIRVPWDYDYNGLDFDGLFLANGPGDPDRCEKTVEILRRQMATSTKPIFGICLGNQLLAKAAGAKIYKLKYGHRSHNQPVRQVGTDHCFITAQNHGYAVDDRTLPADWQPLFVNMNDGSNEGIRHRTNPWFSAQFHPEACSGPTDTEFLFDEFISKL